MNEYSWSALSEPDDLMVGEKLLFSLPVAFLHVTARSCATGLSLLLCALLA